MNIQEIFENVKKDTSLLATLNMNDILKKVDGAEYLENKTLIDVLKDKIDILDELDIDVKEQQVILNKLLDYRYVKNIYELHRGKHIRWIRKTKPLPLKLENGSIVSDIKFTDSGTIIQCLTYKQTVFNIRMDECIIFQKMTTDELMILSLNDNIKVGKK